MSKYYLISLLGQDEFYQHESVLVETEDNQAYDDAIKIALAEYDADWVADAQADDVDVDDVYMLSQTSDHVITLS